MKVWLDVGISRTRGWASADRDGWIAERFGRFNVGVAEATLGPRFRGSGEPSEAMMIGQDTLTKARRERERAEALLRHLMVAKADSERNLASSNEKDPIKSVTGRSSFDNAIASTRKMIDLLDRTCAEAARPSPVVAIRESRVGALVGPVA